MRGNKYLSEGLVTLNGYCETNHIPRWKAYRFKDSGNLPPIKKKTRFEYYDVNELDLFFKDAPEILPVDCNNVTDTFLTTLRNIGNV